MGIERRDVVVLGGGPAGSTFAAILKKYEPNLSVTVLEKARFPRYHIGESLIPALNPVLRDLGI
ncbi:MAG TPA: tryptophan 7-halogenase, partial [Polyangium sp.]|nr:tryptophan 7-halogenase [Polyangium sp.]